MVLAYLKGSDDTGVAPFCFAGAAHCARAGQWQEALGAQDVRLESQASGRLVCYGRRPLKAG